MSSTPDDFIDGPTPAEPAAAAGTTAAPSAAVLLIDDEPFQLKILGRQLANLGFERQERLTDARAAMDLVAREPNRFAVVACDLHMPGMDGVEVVRRLGELGFPGALLLVSGEDARVLQTAERLARARSLRVLGAVKKPAPAAELRRLLAALLDHPPAPTTAAVAAELDAARPDAAMLQRAIAGGELVVHYQPKVALDSGRVLGVEALVRWQRPGGDLLGPDRFVELAEENGLIGPLTDDVLARSLLQLRRWSEAGLSMQVAVNVSMLSLIDQDFPDRVLQALQAASVPASQLVLEITESRLMQQPVRTLDVVTRLRLKRVGLSIDDFGTGHSSLAQLHDLPFEELKLDRRFVTGAHAGPSQQAIIVPTLEMAHQLGVHTVAEGVETLEDWRWLQACGCNAAQGWFIGRPMVADRMLGWVAQWEARRAALVG